jgi:hypothetical protein
MANRIWILYIQQSNIYLHSLTFSAKILGERMKRDSTVDDNDQINLKNKLSVVIYLNVAFLKVENQYPS